MVVGGNSRESQKFLWPDKTPDGYKLQPWSVEHLVGSMRNHCRFWYSIKSGRFADGPLCFQGVLMESKSRMNVPLHLICCPIAVPFLQNEIHSRMFLCASAIEKKWG